MREWRLHKRLIVAVDFDDTVFDYHKVGLDAMEVIQLLRECKQLGFYLILFTAAPKVDDWAVQRQYMRDIGCAVDTVNANVMELPFGNDGKPYFNIMLDDRAGLGQAYDVLTRVITLIQSEPANV